MPKQADIPEEQGTLEEIWAGPEESRIQIVAGGKSQTTYETAKGPMGSGKLAFYPGLLELAREAVVEPTNGWESLPNRSYEIREHKFGTVMLKCVGANNLNKQAPEFLQSAYCVGPEKPIVRVTMLAAGGIQILSNGIAQYGERYVPREIRISYGGADILTAHVESLEAMGSVSPADFTAPADAETLPRTVRLPRDVVSDLQSTIVRPQFSTQALLSGAKGTVAIAVIIGKDGKVVEEHCLAGPAPLREGAMEYVKRSSHRPYVVNGEPIAVDTIMDFSIIR